MTKHSFAHTSTLMLTFANIFSTTYSRPVEPLQIEWNIDEVDCEIAVTRHCCIWHQSMNCNNNFSLHYIHLCTEKKFCPLIEEEKFHFSCVLVLFSFGLSLHSGRLYRHCKKRTSLLRMQLTGHPLQKNLASWKSRSVSHVFLLHSDSIYWAIFTYNTTTCDIKVTD